ncbi:MAG: DUF3592 domain-containing protein [Ruminococcus sp.]|nr:DUF3592 domain-containing protein [Ruminococcus sp.]
MRKPIIDDTKPYDSYETYDGSKPNRKNIRANVILMLVIMLFCSVFVIVALVMYLGDKKREKICTEKLTAVVCENRPRKSSDSDSVTYQPIFEYVYNDHKYITGSKTASSPAEFSVGEEVELYIDPDDPTTIYVPSEKTSFWICCLFGGIGGTGMLISLIILLVTIKNRNKPEEELVEMQYY